MNKKEELFDGFQFGLIEPSEEAAPISSGIEGILLTAFPKKKTFRDPLCEGQPQVLTTVHSPNRTEEKLRNFPKRFMGDILPTAKEERT
jgi:hypothetical protein